MVGRRCSLTESGVICHVPMWSSWKVLNTVAIIRAVLKRVTHGLTCGLTRGGGIPTMPHLTCVPMSEQRWMGYMSLQITPPFMGHMSFGGFNEGLFHQDHCQAMRHFGVRFQAICLLGSLGFWSPINRRLQAFWVTFFLIFLALELFLSLQSSVFPLPQLRSPLTPSCGLIVLPNPASGEPRFY